jgi:hypothetical protein
LRESGVDWAGVGLGVDGNHKGYENNLGEERGNNNNSYVALNWYIKNDMLKSVMLVSTWAKKICQIVILVLWATLQAKIYLTIVNSEVMYLT